jgi:hypothetical protein
MQRSKEVWKYSLSTVIILVLFMVSPAFARHQQYSDQYRGYAQDCEIRLQEMETTMRSQGPETWKEATLASYSVVMGSAVYYSLMSYLFANDDLPSNLESVVGYGISSWPKNPLNNWEPVKVTPGGFSAGDIVFEMAPSSYYSLLGSINDLDLGPLSFELGVYGPSENHIQGCSGKILKENEWAMLPSGLVLILGSYTETAEETMKKIQAVIDQKLAANHEQATNSNGEQSASANTEDTSGK